MSDHTPMQHRILLLIKARGRPLTVRQVMIALGWHSSSTAWGQLTKLESLGLVRRVAGYELTAKGKQAIEETS